MIHLSDTMGSDTGKSAGRKTGSGKRRGSAVYFLIIDYRASQYALDTFAWELKKLLEKKLEAVRVE